MQFTTSYITNNFTIRLLSIKQRYKLNAIHNGATDVIGNVVTVVNKAKIQIECNSQQTFTDKKTRVHCCQ